MSICPDLFGNLKKQGRWGEEARYREAEVATERKARKAKGVNTGFCILIADLGAKDKDRLTSASVRLC